MTPFLQAVAAVLIASILILSFRSQGKDIGLLLSIFVCCGLGCLLVGYFTPVVAFLRKLEQVGSLDTEMMGILLKVAGAAWVGEIATLVCNDAGNGAMGKALQFLTVAVILWLSLPMMTKLLELIETILDKV